jgi:hypothetical protein
MTAAYPVSFDDLQAHHVALVAHAEATGMPSEAWNVMHVLLDAAGFLEHAADMIAAGRDVRDPEVVERVTWAGRKLAEYEVLAE